MAQQGHAVFVVHYFDSCEYDDLWLLDNADSLDTKAIGEACYRDSTKWIAAVTGALTHISERPDIDPQQIAIEGYSLGGYIGIAAAQESLDRDDLPNIHSLIVHWGAKFDTTTVDLAAGREDTLFRATGQILIFPGFTTIYAEDADEPSQEEDARLPHLEERERLPVDRLYGEQHFTQPPPRYTEASLVKTLEEYGIGRPSTYATIISTLQDRGYAHLDRKRFLPTDVGRLVADAVQMDRPVLIEVPVGRMARPVFFGPLKTLPRYRR